MYQSGRAGDEAKKRKSPAKSGRVGITAFEAGMGDFRKNRLQTDFEGIKSLQGNIWAKKYPALKRNIPCCMILEKNLLLLCVGEKNSFSRGFGKKLLTQTKSAIPLPP